MAMKDHSSCELQAKWCMYPSRNCGNIDNGFIIWTNAGLLSIGTLGTKLSEIEIDI